MSPASPLRSEECERRTAPVVRKAVLRLIPFLALLYFVSFLDRVNIGFAALTMNRDLGLSPEAFGLGAGIFFVGYLIFTVPGNALLRRFGASRWIAAIMIVWGAISVMMAFVTTAPEFYVLRFALGAAESGFLPGVMLYLTFWFPEAVRGRIIGYFFAAVPLSNVFGAPLSTWLLGHSVFGLHGWQTMFVVEGVPAILLGMLTAVLLTDTPEKAEWLDDGERAVLAHAVASGGDATRPSSFSEGLSSFAVWRFGLIYFLIVIGLYGFGFFAPQMLKEIGGLDNQGVGLAVAVPYAVATLAMFPWARHSDATGERRWHVALPAFLGAAGFLLAAVSNSFEVAVVAFSLGAVGIYAACPVFWTLPSATLAGGAAASGIALVNSLGNVAGWVGPYGMGWLKASTGGYAVGLAAIAASMAAAGLVALTVPRPGRVPTPPSMSAAG